MPTLPDSLVWTLGATLDRLAPAAGPPRPDLSGLGAAWQRRLDATVARWQAEVIPVLEASLIQQAEHAAGDPAQSAAIAVRPTTVADEVLLEGMREMAAAGAASVVAEAAAAGLDLGRPHPVNSAGLADWACAAADLLAAGLSLGVAREALRLSRPGTPASAVAAGVRTYLGGLTDKPLREVLGGALTRAQNLGRLAVYGGPRPPRWSLRLLADETLDSSTCGPCARIDGTTLPTIEAAMLAYGGAGYLFCEGRERCRGTVRGEWSREDGPAPDDTLWPLGAVLAAVVPQGARHYKRDRNGRFSETDEQKLAAVVKAAKALDPDSDAWQRFTGGQSGAGVKMATVPGGKVVRKEAPDWGSDEPKICADAEYLASVTGGVLDVPVALAHRDTEPAVWIAHHDGPVLGTAEERGDQGAALGRFNEFRGSNAGVRMGLLDVLIGNNDRNDGNLIIGDDEVIGIDHALAFEMVGYTHGAPHPDDLGRMGGDHALALHFVRRDDNGRNHWRDNPMTPGDVIETRARLEALRPAYAKAGRGRWLDNALLLLEQVGEHATGKESIYG